MKLLKTIVAIIITISAIGQNTAPKVYINFVSHNEPDDALHQNPAYSIMETKVLQLADTINSRGAAWNLQTCSGFIKGALDIDGQANNVFRTLAGPTYSDNIEIDLRTKDTILFGNAADVYHILDSLGANVTNTLGGFLWTTTSPGSFPIDWTPYNSIKTSLSPNYPPVQWQCDIIWGAGSYPGHSNDIDNWGIWKPSSASNFMTHSAGNHLYYIGNGCSPDGTDYTIDPMTMQPINPGSFDATDNVSDITTPLKAFIDSIQDHLLPWDRFYNYSITINQSDFSPAFFQKIAAICDSVNSWGTDSIVWSKLTDRLDTFNVWSNTYNHPYSQWACGEVWPFAGIDENNNIEAQIYPNPSNGIFQIELPETVKGNLDVLNIYGQIIRTIAIDSQSFNVDLSDESSGIYLIRLNEGNRNSTYRVIKE